MPTLTLNRYTDPQAFHDATRDFLLENEAANNLIFGIVHTMIHRRRSTPATTIWPPGLRRRRRRSSAPPTARRPQPWCLSYGLAAQAGTTRRPGA